MAGRYMQPGRLEGVQVVGEAVGEGGHDHGLAFVLKMRSHAAHEAKGWISMISAWPPGARSRRPHGVERPFGHMLQAQAEQRAIMLPPGKGKGRVMSCSSSGWPRNFSRARASIPGERSHRQRWRPHAQRGQQVRASAAAELEHGTPHECVALCDQHVARPMDHGIVIAVVACDHLS